jgi:hypothetical protein
MDAESCSIDDLDDCNKRHEGRNYEFDIGGFITHSGKI